MHGNSSPGDIATGAGESKLTHGEFDYQSERVAAGLAEFGLGYGERVVLLPPTFYDLATAYLDAQRAGLVTLRRSIHSSGKKSLRACWR